MRSDDAAAAPIEITPRNCVPANRVDGVLFKNPFADLDTAQTAPLKIEKALIGQVPSRRHGWLVALGLYLFMAFFAIGPGVCVWLALSELMPTRIRSNGMSIALVINQWSPPPRGIFLPSSANTATPLCFSLCRITVIYFITPRSSCRRPRARLWKRSKRILKGRRRAEEFLSGRGGASLPGRSNSNRDNAEPHGPSTRSTSRRTRH